MRFVHTSDWQIGKGFRFADDDTLAVLQAQRLDAINRIGQLARTEGATLVLVAGDVWDMAAPGERTLRQPVERMRQFPDLQWHLIPGNHDPHLPGGLWERLVRSGLPDNVHPHLHPTPLALGPAADGAWLLPAVLDRRHAFGDPTACMDAMATPEGAVRIGLAHGSVRAFGSDPADAHNLLASDRAARAGLCYLALGAWPRALRLGARPYYAGTHESARHKANASGHVHVVAVAGPRAPEQVETVPVGHYRWIAREVDVLDGTADAALDALRAIAEDPRRCVVSLGLAGTIGLAERRRLGRELRDWDARFHHLDVDDGRLLDEPTTDDLDAVDTSGFVRLAMERLKVMAADGADPGAAADARMALRMMYLDHHDKVA